MGKFGLTSSSRLKEKPCQRKLSFAGCIDCHSKAMAEHRADLRTITDEDGAVVLDIREGTICTLNQTGSFIWRALEQGMDEPAIAARLAELTGESNVSIAADVHEFIVDLKRNRLLTR